VVPSDVYDIEKKGKEEKSKYEPMHARGMVVNREKE
jgi:hypothetical protein